MTNKREERLQFFVAEAQKRVSSKLSVVKRGLLA
jgi:hypothetical protein